MLRYLFFLLSSVVLLQTFSGDRFPTYLLRSERVTPSNASISHMQSQHYLDDLHWGCLSNTQQPHHSVNKWSELVENKSEAAKLPGFLPGTTFWINEHMAVGHMYVPTNLETMCFNRLSIKQVFSYH